MAGNIKDVSDSTFEQEILKADLPVVVDFWAPWCGPCKSIAPVLEELAAEFSGRIIVAKVNVDDNPRTPTHYNVRGIPNLVFFKDGEVVNQVIGAIPKEQLFEEITKLL